MTGELVKLCEENKVLRGGVVVSNAGLVMAAHFTDDSDKALVGAHSTALLAFGRRVARELRQGALQRVYLDNRDGGVVVMPAGETALLAAVLSGAENIHPIFDTMHKTAQAVSHILSPLSDKPES